MAFDTVTETGHKRSACAYCGGAFAEEPHEFGDKGVCVICGHDGDFARVVFDANGAAGEAMDDVYVAPDGMLTLPACAFTAPSGKVFSGWLIGDRIYRAGDEVRITEDVTAFAQWIVPFGTPDVVLPGDVKAIEEYAFMGIAASVVYIPDGCETIGAYAFKDFPNLSQIRIPEGCAIDDSAFDGCEHVCVFGVAGSAAEQYCERHDNCEFAAE